MNLGTFGYGVLGFTNAGGDIQNLFLFANQGDYVIVDQGSTLTRHYVLKAVARNYPILPQKFQFVFNRASVCYQTLAIATSGLLNFGYTITTATEGLISVCAGTYIDWSDRIRFNLNMTLRTQFNLER